MNFGHYFNANFNLKKDFSLYYESHYFSKMNFIAVQFCCRLWMFYQYLIAISDSLYSHLLSFLFLILSSMLTFIYLNLLSNLNCFADSLFWRRPKRGSWPKGWLGPSRDQQKDARCEGSQELGICFSGKFWRRCEEILYYSGWSSNVYNYKDFRFTCPFRKFKIDTP